MKATEFRDNNGDIICIGHDLDIIATNQYNGTVNEFNGEICLQTAFFNKPLKEHLTAIDLKEVYITEQNTVHYCLMCGALNEFDCCCDPDWLY